MENTTWSLDALYTSFQSGNFRRDMAALGQKIDALSQWCRQNLQGEDGAAACILYYLDSQNTIGSLASRLYDFAVLTLSADAQNQEAMVQAEKIEGILTGLAPIEAAFRVWLGTLDGLDALLESDKRFADYGFYLREARTLGRYSLSEPEEHLLAKMQTTGSAAWNKLYELLTSTLTATVNGKSYPLPAVRNMAYSADEAERKAAYEAELAAYPAIAPSVAACFNGIKGEVLTTCRLRGYPSPLTMTLLHSRMEDGVLHTMLTACKESLPDFRRYFSKKAQLLGRGEKLPFADLFAPMGSTEMTFTYPEAQDFICTHFGAFSPKLADFAKRAFDNRWVDVYPREGKRGGAFCSNLHCIGESRVLTNFTGSLNDVITLAHELGHGYHGDCLVREAYLNSDYPMPIAETASTFCETLVKQAAVKEASAADARTILEMDISDNAQIIVDILSRFLFEDAAFAARKEGPLSAEQLCTMMEAAQKETYGDALSSYHPYLWLVKPHYYDAEYNYYNFPYAFGLLFSKGLYGEYLKKGADFVPLYDKLLAATGKASLVEVAAMAGIDIRQKTFWQGALRLLRDDIDAYVREEEHN